MAAKRKRLKKWEIFHLIANVSNDARNRRSSIKLRENSAEDSFKKTNSEEETTKVKKTLDLRVKFKLNLSRGHSLEISIRSFIIEASSRRRLDRPSADNQFVLTLLYFSAFFYPILLYFSLCVCVSVCMCVCLSLYVRSTCTDIN